MLCGTAHLGSMMPWAQPNVILRWGVIFLSLSSVDVIKSMYSMNEPIVGCQSDRSSVGPRGLIYFRDDKVCRPEVQEPIW